MDTRWHICIISVWGNRDHWSSIVTDTKNKWHSRVKHVPFERKLPLNVWQYFLAGAQSSKCIPVQRSKWIASGDLQIWQWSFADEDNHRRALPGRDSCLRSRVNIEIWSGSRALSIQFCPLLSKGWDPTVSPGSVLLNHQLFSLVGQFCALLCKTFSFHPGCAMLQAAGSCLFWRQPFHPLPAEQAPDLTSHCKMWNWEPSVTFHDVVTRKAHEMSAAF